jgi:hypothetical protein
MFRLRPLPTRFIAAALPVLALQLLAQLPVAQAQLRIVTYNTTGAPATGVDVVLKSIGEETRNGFAKPIDVLLLQEQSASPAGAGPNNPSPDTQQFVTLLNNMYAGQGVNYAMSNRTGGTSFSGDSTQTLVYRVETVQLIADSAFGAVSGSGIARQPLRYQLRPVGYGSQADFYVYNSHYKASDATSDPAAPGRRNTEALAIRANSNALGEGAHIIYAGDHNFYDFDADEPAWGTLTGSGAGQANDPINQVGTWHDNASFAAVHTQSPCLNSVGHCGVGGGMDDRFDFQLVSGEFLDNEGLSYIGGSYHAFGNNGTTFNKDINNATNTVTFPGVTSYTKSQILSAIRGATDHIPVVADYQLPAVLSAAADSIPSVLDYGQLFNLNVTVKDAANVLAVAGADELDYSLTTSGSLTGSYLNQMDAALGGGNSHLVGLSTSSLGMQSGTITVTSNSQGVQNGTINIPVSFLVVLAGDYNADGVVDAADYVTWRNMDGQSVTPGTAADGDRNGLVDASDYAVWRNHFGQAVGGMGSALAAAVPEVGTLSLLIIGGCLLGGRRTTLRAWNRNQ